MAKKHTAKWLSDGQYEYRGFEIYRYHSEGYGISWSVQPMPDGPHENNRDARDIDTQSTLGSAKRVIDNFLGE